MAHPTDHWPEQPLFERFDVGARHVFDAMDRGAVAHDEQGQLIYINRAAMRIFDHPDTGQEWRDSLYAETWVTVDADGAQLPIEQTPAGLALQRGEVVKGVIGLYRVRDRRFRWLRVTAIPMSAADSASAQAAAAAVADAVTNAATNTKGAGVPTAPAGLEIALAAEPVGGHIQTQFQTQTPTRTQPQDQPPRHVLSLLDDITEQRRDEGMFARLQALSTAGAWECTEEGACYLTPGALRILGLPAQPGTLDAFLKHLKPQDAQRIRAAIDQARQSQMAFELELSLSGDNSPLNQQQWLRICGELDRLDPFSLRVSGTLEDVSTEKRVQAFLQRKNRVDALTGLFNREAILHKLEKRLKRKHPRVAVLYIDLDRFKVINDALGHDVGDLVLSETGNRLKLATPAGGRCARFGGDEFIMLCPLVEDCPPSQVAQNILAALARPIQIGHGSLSVGASIGIACAPQDGVTSASLIQNADAAMYECKRRTGNNWQSYTSDLAHRQRERLLMDIQLSHAIERQELSLHYQPQIDLRTGRLVGVEALMRWHNRKLGKVPTHTFIEHAENNGEINRLGAWALREACAQIRRWRDAGLNTVPVAVNISYRQFLSDDLPHIILDAIESAGLQSQDIELEFTERVLIEDKPLTARTIARLRELDIKLAIDDFGEGYSALSYLRRLPIQKLKLSRKFLQGVPGDTADVAICQAVSTITQSLGLDLIAEGVETAEQRQLLVALGIRRAQGYLFAPPLAADEFAQWLARPDDYWIAHSGNAHIPEAP